MTTPTLPEAEFDLDKIFDNAGGGSGAPSFAWPLQDDPKNAQRKVPVIGGTIQGEITDVYVTVVKDMDTQEPKLDRKGRQQPQVNLTIQTSYRDWQGCKSVPTEEDGVTPKPASEDTGERRIYCKYRMVDALAKAIQSSEQKSGGPRKGAKVAVRVTDLIYDEKNPAGRHPMPDYGAVYKAPVVDLAAEMFDQAAQQAPPPPPAQQAPPPPPAQQAPPPHPANDDPWASSAGGWADEPPF